MAKDTTGPRKMKFDRVKPVSRAWLAGYLRHD